MLLEPGQALASGVDWVTKDGSIIPIDRKTGRKVTWAALPGSQSLFIACPLEELLYEGTRGPGKTDAVLADFGVNCGKGWGSDWVGILFRRTYPELSDVIEKSRKFFRGAFPDADYNEGKSQWVWPTGERLLFRQFAKASDYWKYHGHAYPWICWEELCTWPDDAGYRSMFSCSRSTRPGMPRKVRATANPYGVGHNWVKHRFRLGGSTRPGYGPLILDAVDQNGEPEPARGSIHGHLDENYILMSADPGYKARIRAAARNQAELEAWMNGSWDIVAGGMFDDVWHRVRQKAVIKAFDIPESWRIDRSMDWGSAKPSSIGYWAESDGTDYRTADGKWRSTVRGDIFRIGELYTWNGKPNEGSRKLATEIALMARRYEDAQPWGDRVKAGPGDSSMFDEENGMVVHNDLVKRVRVDGVERPGITFTKADKGPGSRKQGWQKLREYMGNVVPIDEHGKLITGPRENPGLFVFENCRHWVRTVPVLPRDDKDPDDVDTEAEDHPGDETRYRLREVKRIVGGRRSVGAS